MKKFTDMLRKIRRTIFLIAMTMCIIHAAGCNSNENVISVSASEFEKEINACSVQLVDVRTPEEFADGHIAGALNINVKSDDFRQMAEKELTKGSVVLVYCRSGKRSLDAAEILTELGYKVINLKGGIIEWKEVGLPVDNGQN